jgi:DNA-binding NtrC family response regulator
VNSTDLHILIVEDEFTHAFAMRRMLEKKLPDARIEVVSSIRDYENSIAVELPTIVFMDLNLTDGCTLDMLKAAPGPPPFPVIMLSSYAGKQVADEVVQAGAVDFIIKSADFFSSIADIVEKTVREWGQQHEKNSDQ